MTTLYRELTDAYHRGDGAAVGWLLGKIRTHHRARAAEAEDVELAMILEENTTDQFPPPPRDVRPTDRLKTQVASLVLSRELRRYKRLVRDGAIIPGVVTDARIDPTRRRRMVKYTYRPPMAPSYAGRTSGPDYGHPSAGDAVMVFYDARRPWNSVSYEACGFEIPGSAR